MDFITQHCHALFAADGAGIWMSALIGGLLGSASHCSLMCSPILAAQILMLQGKSAPRIALLLPYHTGRATTYMLLGSIGALAAPLLFGAESTAGLRPVLLVLAGLVFIASALRPRQTHACCSAKQGRIQRHISRWHRLGLQQFARGFLMGFMPCGMLLSALLIASSTGSAAIASLFMLLFAAATTPLLTLSGCVLARAGSRLPFSAEQLGRSAMGVNGLALCFIGFNASQLNY